jgi:hypothetical protein
VTARRQTDTFEFTPPEVGRVTTQLDRLRQAGDGWINLLPGVEQEEERTVAPSGLFGLFGNRQAPVTMGTLMPARPARPVRRESEGVTIGLLHPTGAKAVARLAEAGVTMPAGWVLRQDHARRGLVVRTAPDAAASDIITWSIRAGTALCREEMTGSWQAVVYLP